MSFFGNVTYYWLGVFKQVGLTTYGYLSVSKNVKIASSWLFTLILLMKIFPAIFIIQNDIISIKFFNVIDFSPPLPKHMRLESVRLDCISSITLAVLSAACRRFCSLFEIGPLIVDGVRLPGERLKWLVRRGVRRFELLDERRRAP